MQRNITLRLDDELLRRARVLAARRSTSVTGLVRQEPTRLVDEDLAFERARKAALEDLDRGFHLGGRAAARAELHER